MSSFIGKYSKAIWAAIGAVLAFLVTQGVVDPALGEQVGATAKAILETLTGAAIVTGFVERAPANK